MRFRGREEGKGRRGVDGIVAKLGIESGSKEGRWGVGTRERRWGARGLWEGTEEESIVGEDKG